MNMLAPSRQRMSVEIVFDFVCPWCCMGIQRLIRVFGQRQDIEIFYTWRPFLLNPTPQNKGMAFNDYLEARHGTRERADRLLRLIEIQAHEFDCVIHFDRIRNVPSTMNAHRLVEWASARGDCTALVLSIFEAFFQNGDDIGNPGVLADIAAQQGFDHDLALHFLSGQTLMGTVTAGQIQAQKAGINGVPSFIVEGLALTGVHDAPVLDKLMDTALQISDPKEDFRFDSARMSLLPQRV
ncbi:DsbA family oxidoreductase [Acetobacter sp.]|jgi:predicted DsbA family dithiol-disulfide isomerase|uniref:DsbA family oxidoreductase n=1 Tax=Acetobacter sp. TaxID=440 RepID=UPI0025B7D2F8|nr:DsbA family oxidoreductase [Acetobacter sp.]MCH4090564.1 DsbA family oxidoreductase [Acetobacter sp.]MCI1299258.1 DsbA family oxidoreductase [Acetobacter sp.]MCI1315805.1 DsbA family oxidoreductase [Acetobacter sp.]